MGWAGVTDRFSGFRENVALTQNQLEDGLTKTKGIASVLNNAYWGQSSDTHNWLWVGSWGKATQARPPRDIDLFFVLPEAVYHRFQNVQGNKQSQLLQEVRGILLNSYNQTTIRGDGQVVAVGFNTIMVEVLPCFNTGDGRFLICDTNRGGTYTMANPYAEIAAIENGDLATSHSLRTVIKMLKIWKHESNADLKSYLLETLATNFLTQCSWRHDGLFYYDWVMRDFFQYLIGRTNTWLTVPDGQQVWLGDLWKSRAESAYASSLRACDHERENRIADAGDEWQKVFGTWIPKHVTPNPFL